MRTHPPLSISLSLSLTHTHTHTVSFYIFYPSLSPSSHTTLCTPLSVFFTVRAQSGLILFHSALSAKTAPLSQFIQCHSSICVCVCLFARRLWYVLVVAGGQVVDTDDDVIVMLLTQWLLHTSVTMFNMYCASCHC